jgi:ferredoxin-NADP reductase
LERLSPGRRAPIVWRVATVREMVAETSHAKTLVLDVDGWPGHVAGQHVDVRLTSEDGYEAERSYSIASPPEQPQLALTIERIDDGEVSPYLADELRTGDQFELRGPVGGHFTWSVSEGGPLLLVAGGSGLVPLMAMLRHREAQQSTIDTRLLVSAREWDDVLYRDELARLAPLDAPGASDLADPDPHAVHIHYTLTRGQPAGWTGFDRRVDADMLTAVGPSPSAHPRIFICGPTPFVEAAADLLVGLGHPPLTIHAERFGPTGG